MKTFESFRRKNELDTLIQNTRFKIDTSTIFKSWNSISTCSALTIEFSLKAGNSEVSQKATEKSPVLGLLITSTRAFLLIFAAENIQNYFFSSRLYGWVCTYISLWVSVFLVFFVLLSEHNKQKSSRIYNHAHTVVWKPLIINQPLPLPLSLAETRRASRRFHPLPFVSLLSLSLCSRALN